MNCFICTTISYPGKPNYGEYISNKINYTVAAGPAICEITTYTNVVDDLLTNNSVEQFGAVTIVETDVLCNTCLILIDELHRYRCEIRQIEQILLQQFRFAKRVVAGCDPPILGENVLGSFQIQDTIDRVSYSCKICEKFSTSHKEMVAAHHKFHQIRKEFVIPVDDVEESSNPEEIVEVEPQVEQKMVSNNAKDLIDLRTMEEEEDDGQQFSASHMDLARDQNKCHQGEEFFIEEEADSKNKPEEILETSIESEEEQSTAVLNDSQDLIDLLMDNEEEEFSEASDMREADEDNVSIDLSRKCQTTSLNIEPAIFEVNHLNVTDSISSLINCSIPVRDFPSDTDDSTNYCKICSTDFSTKSQFNDHVRRLHENFLFKCVHCKYEVLGEKEILSHMQLVHPQADSLKFENQIPSIELPALEDESDGELICRVCKIKFFHLNNFLNHVVKSHEKCTVCGVRSRNMKVHYLNQHFEGEKWSCPHCPKRFRSQTGLSNHKALHTGKFRYNCELCKRGYMLKRSYDEHIASHTKKPLYSCDLCGRTFIHLSSLAMHKKLHEDAAPYKCNECPQKFSSCSMRKMHHRRVHLQQFDHQCPHCDNKYVTKTLLNNHMQHHNGNFVNTCPICGLGYMHKSS